MSDQIVDHAGLAQFTAARLGINRDLAYPLRQNALPRGKATLLRLRPCILKWRDLRVSHAASASA
jgi:hypothetical protein